MFLSSKKNILRFISIALFALPYLAGCGSESQLSGPNSLKIKTPVFDEGERIPEKFTCEGKDISFPIQISNVPDSTESLAIVLADPDAPGGTFYHWLAWGIEPSVGKLPKAIRTESVIKGRKGMIQGKNNFGSIGYRGPCPPPGSTHKYKLTVYALDGDLNLDPGSSYPELKSSLKGHVIARGILTGIFSR